MSTAPEIRALVLSAGLGQRLRPLTNEIPKPLLPVAGAPVAVHTLGALEKASCRQVAVNLHHLGSKIEAALSSFEAEVELTFSFEESLLGTAGALMQLREFLEAGEAALVINGDSWCRWPFAKMIKRHLRERPLATLLVHKKLPAERYGGGLAMNDRRCVTAVRGYRVPRTAAPSNSAERADERRVFLGAQILSPELLERLPRTPEPGDIIDMLYGPALEAGEKILCVETGAPWHDLGTPSRYLQGAVAASLHRRLLPPRRRWTAPGAHVHKSARVRRSAIEHSASVGAGSTLDECLVLDDARVGRDCTLQECIVGPGVTLPDGSKVESRMITALRAGRDPNGRDSVVGQLVFTPIDESS